jgi:excisionase family DNA binding protein
MSQQVFIPQMLTTDEAAAALRCHRTSVYRLVKLGKLSPPVRSGGKQSLWRADQIAALLQPSN